MVTSFPFSASTINYPAAVRRATLLQRTSQALFITAIELTLNGLAWLVLQTTGSLVLLALALVLAVAGAVAGSALRGRYQCWLAHPHARVAAALIFFLASSMVALLALTGLIRPWILCEAAGLFGLLAGLSGLFQKGTISPRELDAVLSGCLTGLLLAAMLLLVYTHLPVPGWLVFAPGQFASSAAFAFAGLIFLASGVIAGLGLARKN